MMLHFFLMVVLHGAEASIFLPKHTVDYTDKRRIQLCVPNQNEQIGGSTSCGYQALRNSILVSLANIDILKQQVYYALLESQDSAQRTCTQSSRWREKIVEKRALRIARDYLYDALLRSLKGEYIEIDSSSGVKPTFYFRYNQGRGLLLTKAHEDFTIEDLRALSYRFDEVAQLVLEGFECGDLISLNKEQLHHFLHDALQRKVDAGDEDVGQYAALLLDYNLMETYFNDVSIRFIVKEDFSIVNPATNEIMASAKDIPYGDWLQVEEIFCLLAYEREHGWLKSAPALSLCIYGDESQDKQFEQLVQKFRYTNEDIVAPILIYEGNSSRSAKLQKETESAYYARQTTRCSHGHFFTLVVVRKNGNTTFFMADSLKNDRLHDESVTAIVCVLDGVPVPQSSRSSINAIVTVLLLGTFGYGIYHTWKKKKKEKEQEFVCNDDEVHRSRMISNSNTENISNH